MFRETILFQNLKEAELGKAESVGAQIEGTKKGAR